MNIVKVPIDIISLPRVYTAWVKNTLEASDRIIILAAEGLIVCETVQELLSVVISSAVKVITLTIIVNLV